MLKKNLIFAITMVFLAQTAPYAQTGPQVDFPPPGRMIDVGGWKMHLNCTGQNRNNSPTVVFENGAGGPSTDWYFVQRPVAEFTRVCSYDRAGTAWSEAGPQPLTLRQIAYDLHTLLEKAGEKGPFVLVGASLGGLMIRVFAKRYPNDVSGMVLVDGSPEDNISIWLGRVRRLRDAASGRPIPEVRTSVTEADKLITSEEPPVGAARSIVGQQPVGPQPQPSGPQPRPGGPPAIFGPFAKLPPEVQKIRIWSMSRPSTGANPYLGDEGAELYADRQAHDHPLGDIPLIVLCATNRGIVPLGPEFQGLDGDKETNAEQFELAKLSSNSKFVLVKDSGHVIGIEHPEAVISAVKQVVEAVQHKSRLEPAKKQ